MLVTAAFTGVEGGASALAFLPDGDAPSLGLVISAPREGGLDIFNLDGELLNGMAPFRAECVPNALEVYASQLNEKPMDTSEELEPQLVLALLGLFDR